MKDLVPLCSYLSFEFIRALFESSMLLHQSCFWFKIMYAIRPIILDLNGLKVYILD